MSLHRLAFKGSIAYGHIWDEDILPLKGSSVIIAEQCCDRRLIRCDTMKETCEEWEPSISEPVGKLLDAQKWEPSLKPLLALPDWRKLGACEDSY